MTHRQMIQHTHTYTQVDKHVAFFKSYGRRLRDWTYGLTSLFREDAKFYSFSYIREKDSQIF